MRSDDGDDTNRLSVHVDSTAGIRLLSFSANYFQRLTNVIKRRAIKRLIIHQLLDFVVESWFLDFRSHPKAEKFDVDLGGGLVLVVTKTVE